MATKKQQPGCTWPAWTDNTMFAFFVGIILFFVILFLAIKTASVFKEAFLIGEPKPLPNVITVTGTGKIDITPDIALLDLGFSNEDIDVTKAQDKNAQTINQLSQALQNVGIATEDIQTGNYTVYPSYDYIEGARALRGYQVRQSLKIKIRNLDKIGDILSIAGGSGANEIQGIRYSIEDPSLLESEVLVKALDDANNKAIAVAQAANRVIKKMVSYDDVEVRHPDYLESAALGRGGAAPEIEPGQIEMTVRATVVYEMR